MPNTNTGAPSEEEINTVVASISKSMKFDAETLARILSSPPFVTVEGVINFRDVAGVHTPASLDPNIHGNEKSGHRVKSSTFFRSGELTRLTPAGLAKLRDELRVTTIFDLRSKREVEKWKAGTPGVATVGDGGEEEPIKVVRVPVAEEESEEFDPTVLARKVQSFETNKEEAFATLYSSILIKGAPAFETILKHFRDKPDEPCLVHCTAGKDRTGLFAAVVLLLLRAPEEAIIADYTLTTAGLQPALPFLIARFKKDPIYADNWKGVVNMGSASEETMKATLDMIKVKFGGAETYVKTYMSLTDEDIETIRQNLVVQADRNSRI